MLVIPKSTYSYARGGKSTQKDLGVDGKTIWLLFLGKVSKHPISADKEREIIFEETNDPIFFTLLIRHHTYKLISTGSVVEMHFNISCKCDSQP
jgi:hypothetical protein